MRERDIKTAEKFGVLERIKEFEQKLLEVNHIVEVDFDLDGFLSDIRQVIFLPKYDIPVDTPDYFDVRNSVLDKVLAVAKEFGLYPSGDRIEDYGEHFYIVRNCDKSWVLQQPKEVTLESSVKAWYTENYPSDEVGATLNEKVTFADAYAALDGSSSGFYDALGGDVDSVVRERVFNKLSELYGVDYDVIYYKWLNRDVPAVRTVGIYGDEVRGKDWTSTDDIVKYFTERGLKVSDVEGDMEYGWEMNVSGSPSKLFAAIVHTFTGYDCDSVEEFINEYAIDDFMEEKSTTVDEVLGAAKERSEKTDTGVTGKDTVEKEV